MTQTLPVRPVRRPVEQDDPLGVYSALVDRWGADQAFLLESLSGPARDRRQAVVGVEPVLTVEVAATVSGAEVSIEGAPVAVRAATDAAVEAKAVDEDGRLVDDRALWTVLRAVQGAFEVTDGAGQDAFDVGWFGFLSYETAWAIERLPRLIAGESGVPAVSLSVYAALVVFDLAAGRTELVVNTSPAWPDRTVELLDVLDTPCRTEQSGIPPVPTPSSWRDSLSPEAYVAGVDKTLHHIAIGDVYQLQLGHRITVETTAAPADVYRRLSRRNPSPYSYLAPCGGVTVVGASPELYVRVEDGTVTMRPIAGTIPRAARPDPQSDAMLAARLRDDPKERAEHLMLVDLARNDVSRVVDPATLMVDEYMVAEKYSHLIHLVSNVAGRMRPDVDAYDVLAAGFPAGTMTGAPKIRAMEIIEELETARRGVYAGTIGQIGFGGYVNTALCIRTAVHTPGRYLMQASAGIVADSVPEREWVETLTKLGATFWAVTGEELADAYARR
jgi:anthranilate/para-aminobenzoate synthase component I